MTRLLAAFGLTIAALLAASPASAQIDKGCYNYSGKNVYTAKNADKLRADVACFEKAKGLADISIAERLKRLTQIVPPLGDVKEPELGVDFTKVPEKIATKEPVATLVQALPPAPSGKPDTVGAFRFLCAAGQISYDDPLVFHDQPGKSHLHQWFGNTAANAHSTYQSLRTTGDSTCINILNRSAYWMPAMLDGKGSVVRPDFVSVYYKRLPANDPECLRASLKGCVDLPRGLRMIFGHDAMTGKPATGGTHFDCNGGPDAISGNFATITEAAKGCPAGARIGAIINAPPCWDGKRLDSPNHRDHLADVSYGSWGYPKCPSTHPYIIPAFTMGAWYSVEKGDTPTDWYLSSDEMPGMPRMPAGSTFHADWFGAWDDGILARWQGNCIEKLLSCNSGDLGDGFGMKQIGPFEWKANPRLIPIPARPM